MREISKAYIIKSNPEHLKKIIQDSINAGLEYKPYHFIISIKDQAYNLNIARGRPICKNNGLVRYSNISNSSIGIVLYFEHYQYSEMGDKYFRNLGSILKDIALDFCIGLDGTNPLITSFEDETKVDTMRIFNYTLDAKSQIFKKG